MRISDWSSDGCTADPVARHPHVCDPDSEATDVAQLSTDWEKAKVAEKGRASVMDGIPAALPALAYAAKIQKKAASQSVDWRTLGAGIVPGSWSERLLDLVDEARTAGRDAETDLRRDRQSTRPNSHH